MSRRPPSDREYKPRPIAAVAAEVPYRSFQAPRAGSNAGHHARSSTSSAGGSGSAPGSSPSHRSRQRITAGGQTTQSQSDERDEGQPSSNDSSGNSGNSNSSNTKSSGSTNPSSTASANISAASETSLLSTATTPAKEQTATYYPPNVSQIPPSPSAPPPLSFDEFVEHVARTRGMPEPGVDYFYARRVLWLLTPPVEPRPISPSPSRIKLEALLNQPGAVESEEVWKAGLKNVWKGLVGGNQLRKRLPLSIVLKILQAGWLRDGTWPEGMVAPSWDGPSTSAAPAVSTADPSASTLQTRNLPSLPPIAQEYPYHYPYPSRVGAAYSGSPSSGDQVQAEQAALQQQYAMQYGYGMSQAYPSSRPPTEPPTSGTPEPRNSSSRNSPPHNSPPRSPARAHMYDDGSGDDPEGDVDDDERPEDDDEVDEPRYGADDGRHEGG